MIKHCKQCGKVLGPEYNEKALYCSNRCKRRYYWRIHREERACVICGKLFHAVRSRATKTCSPRCASILRHSKKRGTRNSSVVEVRPPERKPVKLRYSLNVVNLNLYLRDRYEEGKWETIDTEIGRFMKLHDDHILDCKWVNIKTVKTLHLTLSYLRKYGMVETVHRGDEIFFRPVDSDKPVKPKFICTVCSRVYKNRSGDSKYCSEYCRNHIPVECIQCGKEFTVTRFQLSKQYFCSRECLKKFQEE